MTKVNILAFQNPKGYTDIKQIEEEIISTTSAVKYIMGVAHALVLFTMLDTVDKVRTASWYEKNRTLFRMARRTMDDYDRNLLHATTNRFFCVKDMGKELRAQYSAALTDRKYFEYWCDMGASCYDKVRPFLMSLQNKYRLALQDYGVPCAEEMSWVVMTEFALEEADAMYKDGVLDAMSRKIALPKKVLDTIYRSFRFDTVHKAWQRVLRAVMPDADRVGEYVLAQQNVKLGINDFHKRIAAALSSCDAVMEATVDNEELFYNKDEFKKAKRQIRSVQKRINEDS